MSAIQNIQVGAECPIELQLADGAANQYPQAKVYDESSTLLTTIDMVHRHFGNYNGTSYSMPNTDYIKVVYVVYSDAGHTAENTIYERAIDVFYKLDVDDYKATGFAIPNEYDIELANIQAEVNGLNGEAMRGTDGANTIPPPDISALALEATSQLILADTEQIKNIENGEWKIENNQMKFYAHSVPTPFLTFDLFDANGDPAMTRVTERRRI